MLKTRSKIYQIFIHLFACIGLAMVAAWGLYKTGITNNAGGIDKNNRYLADYQQREEVADSSAFFAQSMENYLNLAVLSKSYPLNAHLIYEASRYSDDPQCVNRMIYAANMYLKDDSIGQQYRLILDDVMAAYGKHPQSLTPDNLIPWMNDSGWIVLKKAILRDEKAIKQAAELTGVDPRLIVACTVGEQIRLFNSKREDVKRYLGPAVMSVQSTFSFGVNGIKDFTAAKVEANLKDSTSVFYMGKKYENILDYDTTEVEDIATARFNRLVDYRNHLYSYIYTGCILHQTMLQWERAGYSIADRPDILCTLFNLGFSASKPSAEPRCGGSRVSVNGITYTFGVLGNDFFYSGELAKEFPMRSKLFE
ncbi:MAG: hypothetical protein IJT61_03235 [Bacteroidales bacterium]|nr:hypothetical protein [Bacteroidales bacterium]